MLLLIISGAFVLTGSLMLHLDEKTITNFSYRYNNLFFIRLISIAAIVFFGFLGLVIIRKLFQNIPGVIINYRGITDNASGISAGFIPWGEIIRIEEYTIGPNKFASIYVQDPEKYITKGNFIKRLTNRGNYKMTGTPIHISSKSLQVDFGKLMHNLQEYHKYYTSPA